MDPPSDRNEVSGEFLTLAGERYYAIHNVDRMPPFFISVVSNSDHWLFISSTGGLTAGRVSPETALFPYVTVDKVHESWPHTGSKTVIRTETSGQSEWEPYNREHIGRYAIARNLYKNVLGNKLCFEEINRDLALTFRYWWLTSEDYGFVRRCELINVGDREREVELVDGLQNVLPAGTPRHAQTNTSNLVDAYKWSELLDGTGLAVYALYSGITDRAEPCESLKATTVFCLGLPDAEVVLSTAQLEAFRRGADIKAETLKRGVRGAYMVNASLRLEPGSTQRWEIVADVEQSQAEVVSLRRELENPARISQEIERSIEEGSDELARIMASADAFQMTAEENVSAHHYANVLFNVLRGGTFDDQYQVYAEYFRDAVENFNREIFADHRSMLDALSEKLEYSELLSAVEATGDPQLERLTREYLPIWFGRRHGDPSRPWNHFAIELKDGEGKELLTYQGNWRDIFQNWEALSFSFPEFIENVIAKFVNASTMDGYNPYRISDEGIDWEVEDPDDPWSYIGYWGDHQIVYLLRLLELSRRFHPDRLAGLLHRPVFAYANVPYRIKPFQSLLDDPKSTVVYDEQVAQKIEQRVASKGADGKLVQDPDGRVRQVTLLEKLLVPLLSKLGNLVLDGGIWLNTQRPEWNDANNALVGHGVSMVTLYHMRRYVAFLQRCLAEESDDSVTISREVGDWLSETSAALSEIRPKLRGEPAPAEMRYDLLAQLGRAASRYREAVYRQEGFSGDAERSLLEVREMLNSALAVIDHTIAHNRREDGLFHAYNVLHLQSNAVELGRLDAMLEGQVAALSSGAIPPEGAVDLIEALFDSSMYREDLRTFMLYPDRELPGFLERNRVSARDLESMPGIQRVLAHWKSIMVRDEDGWYRFNADLRNANDLRSRLSSLEQILGEEVRALREPLVALYEKVFNHKAFTGRAGTMFGFEGLGSVYWHMVSKLLLATQESFFAALDQGASRETCERLGELYYRIREGLGFNKTPGEYGAFPVDPYSHTPKHAGAQQPGMTGQVKEEILTRFGELGVRVKQGTVAFQPALLRSCELSAAPRTFRFLDVDGQWQEIPVPPAGLAFSWCQVPFVYRLDDSAEPAVTVVLDDGSRLSRDGLALPTELSVQLFQRSGRIRQIELVVRRSELFPG